MYRFLSILLLFSTFITFSQNEYSIVSIPEELIKNANSVLLDELIELDVSEANKMIYNSRRVISIINKKGDANTETYLFYDDFTKIKEAELYVYDAFGNEIQHYKKRDFRDVSAVSGGTLYNSYRVMYLDYIPASYPYTMVFNSKVESSTTAFLNGWLPLGAYASSTKKSIYKINFDPANKPRYKAENFDGFNISISENTNQLVFEASNIPVIRYEDHSPPFRKIAPNVNFSLDRFYLKGVPAVAKNWQELGNWMNTSLLSDVKDLSPGTIEMARSLVKNDTTNEAKARKIYQYLQDKVRYISVQIGIGGWKPMLASEVDKLGYGDCKALTNYTKSLLEAVDVPSYYTVLYAGDNERDLTEDFSSIEGNHAILGVPDGDEIIWLECTSQDTPFGYNGNFTDDRDVLIMTPEGGKIVRTKKYSFQDNLQENKAVVRLDPEGGLSASLVSTYKGLQYDGKYVWDKKTDEEVRTAYKNRWSYINGLMIEDFKLNDNKADIVFKEELQLKASNYSSKVGKDLLFCVNVFNQYQNIPARISERKQDLVIAEGFTDIDKIEVILPDGFNYKTLPQNKRIENKFGSYEITVKGPLKNKIEYSRSLIIKKGTFPPEDYAKYRSFIRKVVKLDKLKILVTPKTL